jgi:uncharacterized protein YjbJ (UPF0337 family)
VQFRVCVAVQTAFAGGAHHAGSRNAGFGNADRTDTFRTRSEPPGTVELTHHQEIDMNQDRFSGICRQLSGKLTENWGRLTNNPRAVNAGARSQLTGKIQECYGRSKEQATNQLKEFMVRNRNWEISNR